MLHFDGFEQFANNADPDAVLQRADYLIAGQLAMVSGRSPGGYAISAQQGSLGRQHSWTAQKFSVGGAITFTGRGSMLWLVLGGETLTFWLDPNNGLPMVNGQQGGALPVANTWYYYELELDRATSKVRLSINNKIDSEFDISAAMAGATSVEAWFGYRPPASYIPGSTAIDNSVKTLDDFYINDGPKLNPIVVSTRFPSVDTISQWFSTDLPHANAVSRLPPEPLDHFIASDTIGQKDEFKSNTTLVSSNPVVATGIAVLARKAPAINAKLGVYLGGTPGADLRSGELVVDAEYRHQYSCFGAVAGDTKAGIENAPFGVTVNNP